MKIISIDWAFHKTGIAIYDSTKKIIYSVVWLIPDKYKIKLLDKDFYKWYVSTFENNTIKADKNDIVLVEVGYQRIDTMTRFYDTFIHLWMLKYQNVKFLNSRTWIQNTLKNTTLNKLKKGQDKQLLADLFYDRFGERFDITQDEIDAIMMLLNEYPNIEIKKICSLKK